MFTGIIQTLGIFEEKIGSALKIKADQPLNLQLGDSLAVNGCCLTVTKLESQNLFFDVSQETLNRTNLGNLKYGDLLNLEKPVTPNQLLGGHIVTGHVDGIATVEAIDQQSTYTTLWIKLNETQLEKYCVHKGSLTVNGVSLTINDLKDGGKIRLDLIPETLRRTNLGTLTVRSTLNLEVDILAKHLERLMKFRQ